MSSCERNILERDMKQTNEQTNKQTNKRKNKRIENHLYVISHSKSCMSNKEVELNLDFKTGAVSVCFFYSGFFLYQQIQYI